jgi:hypothetical protein
MTRSLWRLDGATTATLAEPIRLVQGLRLHLEHTELTTVLMQLGDQQQAYIGVAGCEGCTHGRCTPGCYVELLRRLLRACFDASTLSAVAGGLATRPYRRVALANCTSAATHEHPLGGLAGRPPDRPLARNAAPDHLCGAAGGGVGWPRPGGDAAHGALAGLGLAGKAGAKAREQRSVGTPVSARLAARADAVMAAAGGIRLSGWPARRTI